MLKKIHEGEGLIPAMEEEEVVGMGREREGRKRDRSRKRGQSEEGPLVKEEDMPGWKVFRKEMCSKKNGQQP